MYLGSSRKSFKLEKFVSILNNLFKKVTPVLFPPLSRCWAFMCAGNFLMTGSPGEQSKALICSICQFPGCKYSHHGQFQAISVKYWLAKFLEI